jgi:hypothetical protein
MGYSSVFFLLVSHRRHSYKTFNTDNQTHQELANLFCMESGSKYFGQCCPYGSISMLHSAAQCQSSHRQFTYVEGGCLLQNEVWGENLGV